MQRVKGRGTIGFTDGAVALGGERLSGSRRRRTTSSHVATATPVPARDAWRATAHDLAE
ncbi:MAG: hypothetical protein QOD55_1223, partial [Solirubrobacteraceae bacterium]|nr:hypothetical protein [Solirubrobacteraceae bacterium]